MAICKNKFSVQCRFYLTTEVTGDKPGCMADGDITNPEQDIYCGEIDGDDEKEWELKHERKTT